ncbi:hypothetical protein DL93DRAFT_434884 [Clavulina sp. PMI_390]|nr:hypothetical protein DL93DRAFT_434884 [Clavulina sp. PMI_390]
MYKGYIICNNNQRQALIQRGWIQSATSTGACYRWAKRKDAAAISVTFAPPSEFQGWSECFSPFPRNTRRRD